MLVSHLNLLQFNIPGYSKALLQRAQFTTYMAKAETVFTYSISAHLLRCKRTISSASLYISMAYFRCWNKRSHSIACYSLIVATISGMAFLGALYLKHPHISSIENVCSILLVREVLASPDLMMYSLPLPRVV